MSSPATRDDGRRTTDGRTIPARRPSAVGAWPLRARQALATVALLACALLALAGCGSATPQVARQSQHVDGLTIGLEATESPRLNASERLTVTLADAEGRPVDGADVYVDLTMPAMPMGTNRPIAEPQGQGRYLASTAYTMTGEWDLTVVAEVEGREHRATFRVVAVE